MPLILTLGTAEGNAGVTGEVPANAFLTTMNDLSVGNLPPAHVYFGQTLAMQVIRQKIEKVADTDVPLLILGENGTGKEVLARMVHAQSTWSEGNFVKVNCAAIPGTLIESELFGYEKGAFTGANNSKPGRVELAQNGTLFLDEIADLEIGLQAKLLHFLQDGRFSRIGGETDRAVRTRFICATNRDLKGEVDTGRFRADLYYRISVVQLRLPPLRDRREDIPGIAEYFCRIYENQFEKQVAPLTTELVDYLQDLPWPGNVRELSNGIARYVLIGPDAAFPQDSVQTRESKLRSGPYRLDVIPLKRVAKDAIRELERNAILEALRSNQWNRRKAAEALKISYRALIYKIRDAGLVSKNKGIARVQDATSVRRSSPPD